MNTKMNTFLFMFVSATAADIDDAVDTKRDTLTLDELGRLVCIDSAFRESLRVFFLL